MHNSITPGLVFTHWSILDPAWRPGPGQRHRDAPKARMLITRVTATTVFYRYADHQASNRYRIDRGDFAHRLGLS